MGWGLGLLVAAMGGLVLLIGLGIGLCWLEYGLAWVLVSGCWVRGWGLGWVVDEPESLILAQSERWRHA